MKKELILLFSAIALSGCVSMSKDKAIVHLQSQTASIIGLGSSDELTVSNVVMSEANALGSQNITYRATTAKGRIFDCKATTMAGTIITTPTLSSAECTPVSVHK